jgi:uncharacterized SAM-binding protein YcdF (DUF218 family)
MMTRLFSWIAYHRRLLFAILLVTTLVLERERWLTALGRFLDVSETPPPADAAYVLGGGASSRPFLAGALYRTRRVRRVLVPEALPVAAEQADIACREDELIRRVLKLYEVPDRDVTLLPGPVASTRDEAVALARFLEEAPATSVIVVTHDYHTRRTRLLFRQLLSVAADRVSFVGVPTDGFNAGNWWRSEKGIVAYSFEFVKLTAAAIQFYPTTCALLVLVVLLLLGRRHVVGLLGKLRSMYGRRQRGGELP